MRRTSDLVIWIPVIALMALFFGGVLYSFLVPEGRIYVENANWIGK